MAANQESYSPFDVAKVPLRHRAHLDMPLMDGLLAALGLSLIVLYSASGQHYEMLLRQLLRTGLSFILMIFIAQINPRIFERFSWLLFGICLAMLLAVMFFGEVSKGAQRWLNIGFMRIQPSEFLKIVMPITVAALLSKDSLPPRFMKVLAALAVIAIPTVLIAKQPDLGTAILVSSAGMFVVFLAGISIWWIAAGIILAGSLFPIMWNFVMHDYQKQRILTFLNP